MDVKMLNIKTIWGKLRNGILQILGANTINKVVAVLSNMVITRVLSTDDYGTWSYVLNQYTYFSIISAFGLVNGALQFGAENSNKEKRYVYFKYCLNKGFLINLLLLTIGIVGSYFRNPALPNAKYYLMAYIPVLIFEYVVRLFTTILRCENKIKEYARILNINTVLIALGTCLGAFLGIGGVVFGKYIAYITTLLIMAFMMKGEISSLKINDGVLFDTEIKELWRFSIMACISSALNSLLYLIDVTMVATLMKDATQTAIYKVSTFAPNALSFIPASVAIYILPTLIANKNNKQWMQMHVKRYYLYFGLVNLFITFGVVLFAPLIIRILSGSKYISAVPLFRILMIGYAISATFRTLSANILFGLKKIGINMVINVVSSLADIFMNYFFVSKYGAAGAAYATVISEIIASVIAFTYTIRLIYGRNNILWES